MTVDIGRRWAVWVCVVLFGCEAAEQATGGAPDAKVPEADSAATDTPDAAATDLGDPLGPSADLVATAPDAAVLPPELRLSLQPSLAPNEHIATIRGALPHATVVLYASTDADAAPSCPESLAPACLAFGGELVIDTASAPVEDATVIRVDLSAPTLSGAAPVTLQAASWAHGEGFVSNVIVLDFEPPVVPDVDTDGDGLNDAKEALLGTNPASKDTDADALDDGDEVAAGTDPTAADTDGDGLADGVEVKTTKTDPVESDTDQDLLNDGEEIELGLDPKDPDMDGDTLLDGVEVHTYGTDPKDADTDGDGPSDGLEIALKLDPVKAEPGWDKPGGWDSDGDGIPNIYDHEECDGLDNDGDLMVDEGFDIDDSDADGVPDCRENEDCDCVDDDGDGLIAEHCVYHLQLNFSTTGNSEPHWDGVAMTYQNYSQIEALRQLQSKGGARSLAVKVTTGANRSPAMRAQLLANGQSVLTTASPGWVVRNNPSGVTTGWHATPPSTPVVVVPASCNNWVTPTLDAAGAVPIGASILPATGCPAVPTNLTRLGFAVHVNLCGAIETCDGVDNDGDGATDESLGDIDGDGICDQRDWEQCDNIDNDGDGLVDEGINDNDQDGLCNERDLEECDGIDNDGDGKIDEGVDLNGDGTSDCYQDACADLNPPIITVLGNHEVRLVYPTSAASTTLGTVLPAIGDLAATPTHAIWAIGFNSDRVMKLFRVQWGSPPQFILHQTFTQIQNYEYNQGAIAYETDDTLLLGWDTKIYRYTISTGVLTTLLTDGALEQIRDFAWYQGRLYVVAWKYNVGPMLYRWDRLLNRLDELLFTGDRRMASLAVSPAGNAYLGMEFTFNGAGGSTSNLLNSLDMTTYARTALFRLGGGYPDYRFFQAADFPGGYCQAWHEVCDGFDNDEDGLVDEGFDLDGNGAADCTQEMCDGADNNGNGLIDDGLPDTDGDGICDLRDIEVCDGLDNNGNGQTDEGIDLDGDKFSDCGINPCTFEDVLIVTTNTKKLQRWRPSTGTIVDISTLDRVFYDVAVGPDRAVYGIGSAAPKVGLYQIEPATGRSLLLRPLWTPGTNNHSGITVDHQGRLYFGVGTAVRRHATPTATGVQVGSNFSSPLRDLGFHQGSLYALTTLSFYRNPGGVGGYQSNVGVPGNEPLGLDGVANGIAVGTAANGSNGYRIDVYNPTTQAWTPGPVVTTATLGGLGALAASCQAGIEVCDGYDNDGDGQTDEGFPDNDADGIPNCRDTETCDCVDNDGDGAIDETCTYDLAVHVAADDLAFIYVDGVAVGTAVGHTNPFIAHAAVGAGTHRVGLFVKQLQGPARGVLATVSANGTQLSRTGDPSWRTVFPAGAWYNMTSTSVAVPVSSPPWPAVPVLTASGAQWVFGSLGVKAALTSDVTVCGAYSGPERCDGLDNDQDGQTDEGFPPGCALPEVVCNGIDDDDDGFTDEGFDDTDLDGIADCEDSETCDALDNDGDGLIDEELDADGDGIADCFDVEGCDDLDNDGDGQTDEGFDADADGTPDCFDAETCDALDNDGDGQTDEGFPDWTGDGLPDCGEPPQELCDCEDNDGDGKIDEGCEYTLAVSLTALDKYDVWLDGNLIGTDGVAATVEHYASTITSGVHQVAILARNAGSPRVGVIALVYLNGQAMSWTGDQQWRVRLPPLATGWQTATPTGLPEIVQPMPFTGPNVLTNQGAQWVWTQDAGLPSKYPQNALVLQFDACGNYPFPLKEQCDGIDNTGNGLVDEGFPDDDGDHIANCVDAEAKCNGLDDDGDGQTDEGWPDSDLDGVADCVSAEPAEVCDCKDNDLDGQTDEGCIYAVSVAVESLGPASLQVGAESVGSGTEFTYQRNGLTAGQAIAVGVVAEPSKVLGGGFRAVLTATPTGGEPLAVQVAGPPVWTVSTKTSEAWPLKPFATPATLSTCPITGGVLEDAPWLWLGECAPGVATPLNYYQTTYRVCPPAL